jgi:hypothetical protein
MGMTDEKRQKLIEDLRNYIPPKRIHPAYGTALHLMAADEIERLAEESDRFRRALNNAWRKIEEEADHD